MVCFAHTHTQKAYAAVEREGAAAEKETKHVSDDDKRLSSILAGP